MAAEQTRSQKNSQTASRSAKVNKPPSVQMPTSTLEQAGLQLAMSDPASASTDSILQLQRKAGNRAVQRLLDSHTVQTKLTVGAAGDKYEQEADRVASQVMRSSEPTPTNQFQKEDEVHRLPLADSISDVQREVQQNFDPASSFEAGSEVEQKLSSKGGGKSLPSDTRSFMESRFGNDFSGVKVHTDSESAQLNRSLSAQAFTHGSDIYFGEGKYDPGTSGGKHLLAHELTHVVQQTGGVQRKTGVPSISLDSRDTVQRLMSSAQLKGVAGEPHQDKKFLGFTVKKMSSAYKSVLAALDRYQSSIASIPVFSPSGSTTPFDNNKAVQVYAALDAVRDECNTYVANHGDDTVRTPHIQAIANDVPTERQAIQKILTNPSNYPYTLRDAIQRARVQMAEEAEAARIQSIADTAFEKSKAKGKGNLDDIDEGRKKENDEENKKNPERNGVFTPVSRDTDALSVEALGAYEQDMDEIVAGTDTVPGRAPVAQDWRANTDTSKMGSSLGIAVAENYFRTVLIPALAPALAISEEDAQIKSHVVPDDVKRGENVAGLRRAYAGMMNIFNEGAAAGVPLKLAQFCSQLHALALRKGMAGSEAYLLVSSQLFLRTINPLIMDIRSSVPQGQNGASAVLIMSKLFQDDANNMKHGTKEPEMKVFTDNYQAQITAYVRAVILRGAGGG